MTQEKKHNTVSSVNQYTLSTYLYLIGINNYAKFNAVDRAMSSNITHLCLRCIAQGKGLSNELCREE
jgi:hypothetical protein